MDREKVMNALEHCKSYGQCDDESCPYYKEVACLEKLRQDAISLLKEQEKEIENLKQTVQNMSLTKKSYGLWTSSAMKN